MSFDPRLSGIIFNSIDLCDYCKQNLQYDALSFDNVEPELIEIGALLCNMEFPALWTTAPSSRSSPCLSVIYPHLYVSIWLILFPHWLRWQLSNFLLAVAHIAIRSSLVHAAVRIRQEVTSYANSCSDSSSWLLQNARMLCQIDVIIPW